MKNLLSAFALLLIVHPAASQTTYIANSNAGAIGGTNVFLGANAIIDAIGAASAGDIVYVVPSSVPYNNPTVNKGLSLFGGGFNPDKPGGSVSSVSYIAITASNVRISGMVASQYITHFGSLTNVLIDKCRVRRVIVPDTNSTGNLIIQNCIIGENETFVSALYLQSSSGLKLSNNVIYSVNFSNPALSGLDAGLVENNLFIGTGSTYAFSDVTNSDIRNNIFFNVSPMATDATVSGNTQQNNLSFGSSGYTFSTDNNNESINNKVNQDPMFTNVSLGYTFSFNYDLTLQAGSPAIGAGVGGTDMGVFGGLNPYDVHGTSLPMVLMITSPNTVPQGSNLSVRLEAKGN